MSGSDNGLLSAAEARTANTLSPDEADQLLKRLRSGMERLAENAERLIEHADEMSGMPDAILLTPQMREFLPVDDSTRWRYERDPKMEFPQSFPVRGRLRGYSMAELMAWYIKLLRRRDAGHEQ